MSEKIEDARPFEKTLYIASQAFTRGGDWLLSSWLIVYLDWYVLFGMATGASFNGVFGYIIQRYLVFDRPEASGRGKTPQKFRTFLVVRVPVGLTAAGIIALLCFLTSNDYYPIYALTALGILWYFTYGPQKAVFTGKVRNLHPVFRRLRVALLYKLPKWLKHKTPEVGRRINAH